MHYFIHLQYDSILSYNFTEKFQGKVYHTSARHEQSKIIFHSFSVVTFGGGGRGARKALPSAPNTLALAV
jgi:hypothetical protein